MGGLAGGPYPIFDIATHNNLRYFVSPGDTVISFGIGLAMFTPK